jgi:hypothetical protein
MSISTSELNPINDILLLQAKRQIFSIFSLKVAEIKTFTTFYQF